MSRIDKGFSAAVKAAGFVTHSRYRIGASLFIGKRLVSIGWNQNKTHPKTNSIFRWQHAELNCLVGTSKIDLYKATMFVVRINNKGQYKVSKPCKECMSFIMASGIKKVWFINRASKKELIRL